MHRVQSTYLHRSRF